MEWECPICGKQSRNPEEHAKHLASSSACAKKTPQFGWQGDTIPIIVQKADGDVPQSEWGKPLPANKQAEFRARWYAVKK